VRYFGTFTVTSIAAIVGREIGDILIRKLLHHDRHHVVLALALAEGVELTHQILLGIARNVRRLGHFREAVEAVTGLALQRLLPACGVTLPAAEADSVATSRTEIAPMVPRRR
jgi:hypothetical protein